MSGGYGYVSGLVLCLVCLFRLGFAALAMLLLRVGHVLLLASVGCFL